MATLYFDTAAELRDLPSQYRLFNWQRAVVIEKESHHSLFAHEMHSIWSHILSYLGSETLSMRKVCSYFTQSVFNDLYKNSPVIIDTMTDRLMCMGFITCEKVSITNPRLMLGSNLATDKNAFCTLTEGNQIVMRMKNLEALPPVVIKGEQEVLEMKAGNPSIAPFVTELSYSGNSPRWSYLLDQDTFPLLRKLECVEMHMIGDTQITTSHSCLQSLVLSWRTSGLMNVSFGMNRRELTWILNACPNIENLALKGPVHLDTDVPATEPALELNPNRHLKDLMINCSFLKSDDLDRFLDAYPDIQNLELIGTGEGLEVVFSTRADGEFQYLEKVRFHHCKLTMDDYVSLLFAAPNMRDMNISSDFIFGELDIDRLSGFHFPAMRRFALQSPQAKLLPLVERMPNLEELNLIGCQVENHLVNPQAYKHLKSLWVTGKSSLNGDYLNAILMSAKELEEITWDDSRCPWMFEKLEEGALSQLKTAYIQHVNSSYAEMLSLLRKAVRLEKLLIADFSFVKENDISKFDLPEHSLPTVREFEETKLALQECLIIIKAASQLVKLNVPLAHLSVFSELPDGYLSKLEIIPCLQSAKFEECKAILPQLQRVAPNLQLPAWMIDVKET